MAPLTPSAATSEACDGANHTSTPWSWSLRMYKWGCKSRRGTRGGTNQKKMEVTRLNWALTVAGFLLWTGGGTAAPMECHFNSRGYLSICIYMYLHSVKDVYLWVNLWLPELCVFEGRHYSLGETWVDNNCMQCTCLHPVGVGCCEMWVLKQSVVQVVIILNLVGKVFLLRWK